MKMKKPVAVLMAIIAAAMLLSSCATSIPVKVTRPAVLDMNGANTVAVLPFSLSGGMHFDPHKKNRAIDILRYLLRDTDPDEVDCANFLTDELRRSLAVSNDLELVDDKIVRRALERGDYAPVDAYLTGSIIRFDHKIEKEEHVKTDADGNDYIKVEYRSVAYIRIQYQVIDARTDSVIAYRDWDYQNRSWACDNRRDCPSPYQLLKGNLSNLAGKILKEIQPYEVTVYVKLLSDKEKNPENRLADELAKKGLVEDAYKKFYAYYKGSGNFVAGYNSAKLLQVMGNLDDAKKLMSELYSKFGDKRAADAMKDIQYEIDQANRLQDQRDAQEEALDWDDEY